MPSGTPKSLVVLLQLYLEYLIIKSFLGEMWTPKQYKAENEGHNRWYMIVHRCFIYSAVTEPSYSEAQQRSQRRCPGCPVFMIDTLCVWKKVEVESFTLVWFLFPCKTQLPKTARFVALSLYYTLIFRLRTQVSRHLSTTCMWAPQMSHALDPTHILRHTRTHICFRTSMFVLPKPLLLGSVPPLLHSHISLFSLISTNCPPI